MKNKFDLEKAKAGHEVECEGFSSTKIIDFDFRLDCDRTRLAVKTRHSNGSDFIVYFDMNGESGVHKYFLTMKPRIKTYYANVFDAGGVVFIEEDIYTSEGLAIREGRMQRDYVKTISFEIEI